MYRKGTIILPILVVLIVISFALAVTVFYLYQTEHTQNIQLKEQVTELESRQKITEGKLSDAKKQASELALKLQESNDMIDSLTKDLDQKKAELDETNGKLDQAKSDLEQQKSLRQDLEGRLKTTQDEGKQIKEQIALIQKQKTELEDKIKNMESGSSGVELGKVVVSGEPTIIDKTAKGKVQATNDKIVAAQNLEKAQKLNQAKALGVLEGKVMIINKEFNFAVINLGSKDKVSIGDEFRVTRNGKFIGDLKVEKVHESMSAAGFIPEIKDQLQENDLITQKVK
jgi:flagellar basal body-associated protein FliL